MSRQLERMSTTINKI